jgi:hypothetical protein
MTNGQMPFLSRSQEYRFFIVRYLGIYLLYFKQLRIECMVNLKNSLLDNEDSLYKYNHFI